jgi:hypothetical protein
VGTWAPAYPSLGLVSFLKQQIPYSTEKVRAFGL